MTPDASTRQQRPALRRESPADARRVPTLVAMPSIHARASTVRRTPGISCEAPSLAPASSASSPCSAAPRLRVLNGAAFSAAGYSEGALPTPSCTCRKSSCDFRLTHRILGEIAEGHPGSHQGSARQGQTWVRVTSIGSARSIARTRAPLATEVCSTRRIPVSWTGTPVSSRVSRQAAAAKLVATLGLPGAEIPRVQPCSRSCTSRTRSFLRTTARAKSPGRQSPLAPSTPQVGRTPGISCEAP